MLPGFCFGSMLQTSFRPRVLSGVLMINNESPYSHSVSSLSVQYSTKDVRYSTLYHKIGFVLDGLS